MTTLFAEIPIMEEGRLIPFSTLDRPLKESDLVIPAKMGSPWVSLFTLRENKDFNFTYFTDEEVKQIIESPNPLEKIDAAYKKITGKNGLPSQVRLQLEGLYQKFPFTKILWVSFFITLPLLIVRFSFGKALFRFSTLLLTLFLTLRIVILGRPPVSNMEESLLFAGWISAALISFVGINRESFFAASFFLVVLLSTLLPYKDPLPLYALAPVLNSNFWLTIHVLCIVSSYGILIPVGIFAHLQLIQRTNNYFPLFMKGLYLGTITLISGTLLGGVWAGLSWGRFWGWDPKESWAFISSLIYLFFIHGYRRGQFGPLGMKIGAILGMISLTFTWYGVNYILASGLHSYGFGAGSHLLYYTYLLLEFTFIIVIFLTRDLKIAKK